MNFSIVIALFVSFLISMILGPIVIPMLRKFKFGQTVRAEGVQAHLEKTGTPTMGGIMIILSILITGLIFMGRFPQIIPVLILTVGFGLIGFIDDYLKIVKKRSDGLFPMQKMILQLVVTAIFAVYIMFVAEISLALIVPFTGGYTIDLGWFAVVLLFIAVIGTVNGTNFTDGLDGLATSVTIVVAGFFTVASLLVGGGVEPITAAVGGALLGFLVFNVYPAKVFMGDTGSLALGGFVIGTAYILQMPLFVIIVGAIYLIEVLSVILQVGYFKLTKGKRLFKMAPIHHLFGLVGRSETRIVAIFTIITALLSILALAGV